MIRMGEHYSDKDGKLTQAGYAALSDLDKRLASIERALTAIAAFGAPTGGATVDTQARASIVAIQGALG